jgi:succinate dehydrogenase hydrophobic anchor subunit
MPDGKGSSSFNHEVIGLDLVIEDYLEKLNFDNMVLSYFDAILGKI